MKPHLLLPVVIFFLVISIPALAPRGSTCPVTYCVSLTTTVSIGAPAAGIQLGFSLVLIAQILAVAFAVSQSMVVIAGLRKRTPSSVLGIITHLKGLAGARTGSLSGGSRAFWLPIESISAGRITSKMVRGTGFFGPGRRN